MKAYVKYLLLSVMLAVVASCEKIDPPNMIGGEACTADTGCKAPAAVCDLSSGMGVCVQCTPARAEACTGETPACGANNLCEACDSHGDCASDACLPTGSCAAEAEVVYLKQGSTGTICTKDAACGALGVAIGQVTATRAYIRVTGTINNSEETITGKQIKFLGSKDAVDSVLLGQGGGGSDPLLNLRTGTRVEIYDLTLRSAEGPVVRVDDGATVQLERSKIQNADEEGILVFNGRATVSTSEISGCGNTGGGAGPRRGIALIVGELTVSSSKIFDNAGGGIFAADNQKFTISNSFIVSNRGSGGVQAVKPGAGSKFEFNTVADNRDDSGAGLTDVGGILCDDATLAFSNNIIFRNLGGIGGFVQTVGGCTYPTSFISPSNQADNTVLGFVKDTMPRDYHLTAASPATVRDVAGVTCTGLLDIDGEPRPQGSNCDLGADEYKP